MAMLCIFFKDLRKNYIKPYYYQIPSMKKFIEMMNTRNYKKRSRLMIYIKLLIKVYIDTLIMLLLSTHSYDPC